MGLSKMIDTGDLVHRLLIGDRADTCCPAVDRFYKGDQKLFGNDRKGLEIKPMLHGSMSHAR